MRGSIRVASAIVGVLLLASMPGAFGTDLSEEGAQAAIVALGASLDVERDIHRAHQESYRRVVADRDAAGRRLTQLLADLDAMAQSPEPVPFEQISAKDREVAEAERGRAHALERCREILGRIHEAQDRISGLERKLAALRDLLPKPKESLTGNWQIIYLPGGTRGVFSLRQAGTLVQGQYQLDGGWKGSLQGTFIDGKVFLQRIDSKLGRSSELQGYLSSDGKSIRGTWQNYNLGDSAVSSGSWTASRLEE